MSYYLVYVVDSDPKMKRFRTRDSLERFIDNFITDLDNGSWLDFYFQGKPTLLDLSWKCSGSRG